ncbi:hypothetical protein [Leptolyngbya sp. O-77]|uniref:hypothetical protein n=1 Tax=Leptolyngbya sp. O-77 TaxID=1080068 RepID=UPI0012E37C30|nr:hypothetical protein [Leptolyngbya sp. O-77]
MKGLQRIEATLNHLDTLPEAEPRADRPGAQSTVSPETQSVAQSVVQSVAQPATQPAAPVLLELPFGGKLPPASQGGHASVAEPYRSAVAPSPQAVAPTVSHTISPPPFPGDLRPLCPQTPPQAGLRPFPRPSLKPVHHPPRLLRLTCRAFLLRPWPRRAMPRILLWRWAFCGRLRVRC